MVLLVILLLLSVVFLIVSTNTLNLHPFLALLFAALGFGLFAGMPLPDIIASVNEGFGSTLGYIGILIVTGTIIGTFLEHSGGAFALAERIIKAIGDKHIPLAMSIIGYIVSIPVYADSGFVILSPLNRALSKKAKITLAATAIALSLGLTAAHTLVPPTPGPIAAAGILEADLGLVILFAIPVSLFAMMLGWFCATRLGKRIQIDPNPDLTSAEIDAKLDQAPPAWKSLLPILIPILLIVTKSISEFPTNPVGEGFWQAFFIFIGDPVIALLIGVLLAFTLPRVFEKEMLSSDGWVGQGLVNAAIIILITGAGGAFGKVLQNSGIADVIGESLSGANLGIWLPFILAAAIKTAQGSSTVAIITTASLVAPLLPSLGFETAVAKAFVVLAIGAGSMVASHANDSFFWVVTQMSDMDVRTGYKLHSLGTLIMGIGTAGFLWVLSWFAL